MQPIDSTSCLPRPASPGSDEHLFLPMQFLDERRNRGFGLRDAETHRLDALAESVERTAILIDRPAKIADVRLRGQDAPRFRFDPAFDHESATDDLARCRDDR